MTILDKIVKSTLQRVKEKKKKISLEEIKENALDLAVKKCISQNPFYTALKKAELSIIAEVKKASPSKGIIAKDFDPIKTATEYEKKGFDAISVLTEPEFFLGSDNYLIEISKKVSLPLLRKDFIIDEYMIYEAKTLGANAVLLIVSILADSQIKEYLKICADLGLAALVETHNEKEVERALKIGAEIIGVNNRNLSTFEESLSTTKRLRPLVPRNKVFVSESGIKTRQDIKYLEGIGIDAVLIGEACMKGLANE